MLYIIQSRIRDNVTSTAFDCNFDSIMTILNMSMNIYFNNKVRLIHILYRIIVKDERMQLGVSV